MTWAYIGAAAATAVISGSGQQVGGAPAPAPQLGGAQMPQKGALPQMVPPQMGPPMPVSDAVQSSPVPQMGPPQPPQQQSSNPFGGFFGKMDNNLSSPSKQLGIGLLGEMDPRLGWAGLLASGIFGKPQ